MKSVITIVLSLLILGCSSGSDPDPRDYMVGNYSGSATENPGNNTGGADLVATKGTASNEMVLDISFSSISVPNITDFNVLLVNLTASGGTFTAGPKIYGTVSVTATGAFNTQTKSFIGTFSFSEAGTVKSVTMTLPKF